MKIKILSRDEIRQIDRIAIDQFGIPGSILMENAGRSFSDAIIGDFIRKGYKLRPALQAIGANVKAPANARKLRCDILCGGGNNGGDGYVVARHLHLAGAAVNIHAATDPKRLKGDASLAYAMISKMKIPVHEILTEKTIAVAARAWKRSDVVIDALLGTGFTGVVRPPMAGIIERCNHSARIIYAVDVPSGLDCETGAPANATIKAATTVTFVAIKKGFLNPAAKAYLGKVIVAGIGAPWTGTNS